MRDDELMPEPPAMEDVPTADLVREALEQMRELVRVEVEMAKSEIERELSRAKLAAVALGLAAATLILVLCSLVVAAVLALGGTPRVALAAAAIFFVIAAVFALVGYATMPKKPLGHTRRRLEGGVQQWKERIA